MTTEGYVIKKADGKLVLNSMSKYRALIVRRWEVESGFYGFTWKEFSELSGWKIVKVNVTETET